MANPTVAELIAQAREIVREKSVTVKWDDDDKGFMGFITSGLENAHMDLRRLAGEIPDENHPYWRQFHKVSTIATVATQEEYSLPSTETDRFDIFIALVDANTNIPLEEYKLKNELAIRNGVRYGLAKRGAGRFAFYPGNKIRILVRPGNLGTPVEAKNLSLYYFRGITHHESTSDTTDIRDEFSDPAGS